MRLVKLPFKLPYVYSDDGNVSRAIGLVEISESGMVFEFQNEMFGAGTSDAQEASLSLFEIRSVELKTGWFGNRLIVEATSLSAMNGIPGSKQGRTVLKIPRREREAAKRAETLLAASLAHEELEGLRRELGGPRGEGQDYREF